MAETDRVILGDGSDCVFSTDPNVTGMNNNILVVGGSGSGKTMSLVEPALLEAFRRSIILTVTKRRIIDKYRRLLKRRGYDVWDLNFVHPERGDVSYDPMDYIKSYEDITFLSTSVVMFDKRKQSSHADPFWDQTAISLLNAIITYVRKTKEKPTFADVLDMIDHLEFEENGGQIITNYDDKFDRIARRNPSDFAVVNFRNFTKNPIKTASCVFTALNACIASVFTPELRKMFRLKNKVDFKHLAAQKTVLFVTSSPVNPALNNVISMFYGHAFKQLFELGEEQATGRLPIPVQLIADDAATGCPIPMFDQYCSIFREKGISVMLLLQDESQLTSLYGESGSTLIINNMDSYVFMGSNDLESAKNISLKADLPLQDVLHMKIGRQILFRRGEYPKVGRRYNILENETYKEVTKEYENSLISEKRTTFSKVS